MVNIVILRAMDFLVELFRNLLEHEDWTMPQACADSYQKTLKKWHGWLASSTFSVLFFFILVLKLLVMCNPRIYF